MCRSQANLLSSARETETFCVAEGNSSSRWATRPWRPPAGMTIVSPRDIPHNFRNVGNTGGRLLLTIIPGRFAYYFIDADGVDRSDVAAITAPSAHYGVEILA